MINITYTVNPYLREVLNGIDARREYILRELIRPQTHRYFVHTQWVRRIRLFSHFGAMNLSDDASEKVLTERKTYSSGDPRQLLFNYRSCISFVREEWAGNPDRVTVSDLEGIFRLLTHKVARRPLPFPIPEPSASQLLTYLQSQEDHPLITASVIASQIIRTDTTIVSHAFSSACGYIFLYKTGYDFRDLIVFEAGFVRDSRELTIARDDLLTSGNANAWIQAVINAVARDLETLIAETAHQNQFEHKSKEFMLTERQRAILDLAGVPGTMLTNRAIKKKFKISQITASRDLSRLAALGLLYPHGKGRNVKYSKI